MAKKKTVEAAAQTQTKRSPLEEGVLQVGKILGKDDPSVLIDPASLTQPLPHFPTGSISLDHLIGGQPNRFGVPPCPGWPRGKISQVYGHESSGKCLPADAYVWSAAGLQTVGEVFEGAGVPLVCTQEETPCGSAQLVNREGVLENTTHLTCNGKWKLFSVKTASGHHVRSTSNHPHLVMSEGGNWVWRRASQLRPGDYLLVPRGGMVGSLHLEADEAYLMGLVVANGHLEESRIQVMSGDSTVKMFLRTEAPRFLGTPKEYSDNNEEGSVSFHFETPASFYERSGLRAVKSQEKTLSAQIRSFDTETFGAFLRGYMDSAGEVSPRWPFMMVDSASRRLLQEVKILLQGHFGIVAALSSTDYPMRGYWRLTLSRDDARMYVEKVGALSSHRKEQYAKLMALPRERSVILNQGSIPHCEGLLRDLYDQAEISREPPQALLTYTQLSLILDIFKGEQDLLTYRRLEEIRDQNYYYDPVVAVEEQGEEPTFDFAMSSTHSFVVEGVVTHNTTVALTAAAEVCRQGGTVVFIDWEHALDTTYAAALGVPVDNRAQFYLAQPLTLEDGFKILWIMAAKKVDLIILDSVGAGIPAEIFGQSLEKQGELGRVGLIAAKWSTFLPKVHSLISKTGTHIMGISQLRSKINTTGYGGDSTSTQGGVAWKFYASIRLKFARIASEKGLDYSAIENKMVEKVLGSQIKATVDKSKVSRSQKHEGTFWVIFGSGIDDFRTVIEICERHNVVKKGGAWYSYVRENGEEIKGQGLPKFRAALEEKGLEDELYRKAIEALQEAEESRQKAQGPLMETFDLDDMDALLDSEDIPVMPEV